MFRLRILALVFGLAFLGALSCTVLATSGGYFEDFSESKAWYAQYWNTAGFIEIRQEEEGKVRFAICPEPTPYTLIELDFLFVSCTDGMAGILLMSSEEEAWDYGIFFDAEAKYYLYWISPAGDTWKPVRSAQAFGAKSGLQKLNHVSIELAEKNIYVSVDDGSRFSLNTTIQLGAVRLAVANFEDVTAARFDNLHFYSAAPSPMAD